MVPARGPTRILGVPLIAGLSFEVIKWAGRNRARRWVQVLYAGLQLQRLTTREPDLDQLTVSIAALEAVLALETPGASAADLIGLEVVAEPMCTFSPRAQSGTSYSAAPDQGERHV